MVGGEVSGVGSGLRLTGKGKGQGQPKTDRRLWSHNGWKGESTAGRGQEAAGACGGLLSEAGLKQGGRGGTQAASRGLRPQAPRKKERKRERQRHRETEEEEG